MKEVKKLEKKPDNKTLRNYAKIFDKKHPFNKIPKEKKFNVESIFIKKKSKK
jgi:hypothetical protein